MIKNEETKNSRKGIIDYWCGVICSSFDFCIMDGLRVSNGGVGVI